MKAIEGRRIRVLVLEVSEPIEYVANLIVELPESKFLADLKLKDFLFSLDYIFNKIKKHLVISGPNSKIYPCS